MKPEILKEWLKVVLLTVTILFLINLLLFTRSLSNRYYQFPDKSVIAVMNTQTGKVSVWDAESQTWNSTKAVGL